MYRRTLRDQFFPGAVIDITELKRLISGTGKMSFVGLPLVRQTATPWP